MAKRVTSKAIGKAIEAVTGDAGVQVLNGGGYWYFASDVPATQAVIEAFSEESVMVFRIGDMRLEAWVSTWELKRAMGVQRARQGGGMLTAPRKLR